MHIRLDAREVHSSGIGVYIQNVVAQFPGNDISPELLCRYDDENFFKQWAKPVNVKHFNAPLYSLKETLLLPFKTIGSRVFWSPHYNVPLINFASALKVVTVHDVYHLAYYNTLSAFQKVYARLMINKAVKNSDLVFTVSRFSKNEIIKYTGCTAEKVHVIYNGINFDVFNQIFSEGVTKDVMGKYCINAPYILFVGNIKPHKNLKNALIGFKEFYCNNSSHRELKFVIAGKREGFITGDNDIKGLLSDPFYTKRIQFTGWVPDTDLPVLYQQASVFVFPSVYEGFGFPPLEAMAAGCPVISSNTACMPEVYEDAAEYFNPLQPAAIAETMSKVLDDQQLKSRLRESGFVQAKKYTWKAAVKEKITLIEQYAFAKERK